MIHIIVKFIFYFPILVLEVPMSTSSPSNKRKRFEDQGKKKKRSFFRVFSLFTLLLIIIIAGLGFGFIFATMQTLPNVDDVKPAASSQIYDVHGNLITTIHSTENRLPVTLADTPNTLQNAFIAAEDSRFYSHHGIDPKGILRAAYVNITHQGVAEGGSTITQQLARNAFLTQDRTFVRKVKESLLALKIEQTYTKPEILEMYMNQIYFGQGAYGVEAASHTYFNKDVKDLTLAQAALLAGLPNSPNYLNPFDNIEAAKARQEVVLDQMVKYGYISQEEADKAKNASLKLASKPSTATTNSVASYFIDYVTKVVADKYGDDAIYKGGLKVYTTIDMDAQKNAVEALNKLPTFYTDKNGLQQPQGALVAINPRNGFIVAMAGGRGNDYFNRATQAVRQPGSAMKPFVYLAAIQEGMTPGTVMEDKKVTYGDWTPQNYERTYSGKVTLRYALAHSINVVAVELASKVGISKVIDLAKEMGLSTLVTDGQPNDLNLASALGGLSRGVTPLDLTAAYAVIANGGVKVKPVGITKIVDRNGQILEEYSPDEKRIVSEKDAYILTNMLETVITSGTGGNAYFGRPMAGKTGTTDDSKDAWFVGYTPTLVTTVWMGDDFGSETLNGITGGTTPAEIWRYFMSATLANAPAVNFTVPDGVSGIVAQGFQSPAALNGKTDDKNKDKDKNTDKDKVKDGTDTDTSATDTDSGDKSDNTKPDKPATDKKTPAPKKTN